MANSSASCSSRLIKKKEIKKKKRYAHPSTVSRKLGALKIVAHACEPRFFGIQKHQRHDEKQEEKGHFIKEK